MIVYANFLQRQGAVGQEFSGTAAVMLFSHVALAGGVFLIPGLAIQTAVRLGRDFFAGQNTIKNGAFFVIGTGHFHKTCFINPKLKYTANENMLKMIDQGPKAFDQHRHLVE